MRRYSFIGLATRISTTQWTNDGTKKWEYGVFFSKKKSQHIHLFLSLNKLLNTRAYIDCNKFLFLAVLCIPRISALWNMGVLVCIRRCFGCQVHPVAVDRCFVCRGVKQRLSCPPPRTVLPPPWTLPRTFWTPASTHPSSWRSIICVSRPAGFCGLVLGKQRVVSRRENKVGGTRFGWQCGGYSQSFGVCWCTAWDGCAGRAPFFYGSCCRCTVV